VNFPNAFWAGWYDLFLLGTLQAFDGYNTRSNPAVHGLTKMTIDPLGHCLDFSDFWTENVIQGRTGLVLAQLFEVYGIFPVQRAGIKNVTFYVMSSNDDAGKQAGQYWTSLDKFPTPKMTDYFLHADKSASTVAPADSETLSTSYQFDPSNPVPTFGGNNLPHSIGGTIPCGPMDQTPADIRSDVLAFNTPIFTEELPLTGPLFATLYVSSDVIDTDFMVKISDVYPTGESRIIQDNAIRMRWRDNTLDAKFMEKGQVYKIEVNIWNTSYIVAPGHALRFTVTSSNYPRFSINPNNGLLLADSRYPGENVTAINTLYHSAQYPSKFTLPIVNKRQLPEVKVLKEVQTMYPHLTDDFLKSNAKHIETLGLPKVTKNLVPKKI
jgi:putative CocE/NonD family hydrolase